jgi:hypothetical protein
MPPPQATGCGTCDNRAQPEEQASTLDELFDFVKSKPRDLDRHAETIKGFAAKADHVTAFVKRREWNALLAAGRPRTLIVYQAEKDDFLRRVHTAVKAELVATGRKIETYTTHEAGPGADSLGVDIIPTDLLVIDTVHHADRLWAELERHAGKVRSRIILRGTGAFGEQAEGGGPGLLVAVRRFVHEHPEWTVIHHTTEQYGLTVLSRNPADKKALPSLWSQGVNAAKASWRAGANVLTGYGPIKDSEAQDGRLALCLLCDQQTDGKCSACGCPIDRKTSYPTEQCPLGKWPAMPQQEAAA